MSFEFGVFHEFQRRPGQSEARGLRHRFRAGRWRRALGARRDLARGNPYGAGALGVLGADDDRQRDCRPHPQHQNRHRCPGAAIVPAIAACRRRRDRRPHQPWPADFRGRPQRLSARLRGLWHPLRREPGALYRGARGRQARLDGGDVFVRRQISTITKMSASCQSRTRSRIRRSASPPIAKTRLFPPAEQGYAIFVGARRGTFDEVLPNVGVYREAWKAAGHPGNGEVYLRAPVYVGDTLEQALSDPQKP